MDYINDILPKNPIYFASEEFAIFFDKLNKLDPLPGLMNFNLDKASKYNIKISTPATIEKYFEKIIDGIKGTCSVECINGLELSDDPCLYDCETCKKHLYQDWYYCFVTQKAFCADCLNANNSNTTLKPVRAVNFSETRCDLCVKDISYSDRYTRFYVENGFNDRFEICLDCYENRQEEVNKLENSGKFHFLTESRLTKIDDRDNHIFNYTGMNSMTYWIPILEDDENQRILMNLNPEDENYGKFCIQTSYKYGEELFYDIIYEEITLDILLDRLNKLAYGEYDDSEEDYSDNDKEMFPISMYYEKYIINKKVWFNNLKQQLI